MSKSNKTLVAIEEKRKWKMREKELLKRIEAVNNEKKRYIERIKVLKEEMKECDSSIFAMSKATRDIPHDTKRVDDIIR
ncbi:MAG: hypothetical protein R6U17_06005 [Thermoplasmata archaeon]